MNSSKSTQLASSMDSRQLLSSTIDFLRFPLAVMVVFIHVSPSVISPLEADFPLFSDKGIYNIIGIFGSHVLSNIAVPTFFLISGFLFFNNFQYWSWDGYKSKLRSRARSLFIPYVLWNLLPYASFILGYLGAVILGYKPMDGFLTIIQGDSWHIFYDYNEWGTTRINWLGNHLRMTGPYILSLWFLRDLMVVTLLTPILYIAIRKFKLAFIIFLFFAYISRIWPLISGFHITAVFFFSTGAYLALNNLNIVLFANRYRYFFIPASIILLVLSVLYDSTSTTIGQNVFPLFICCGVFTAFVVGA